jgi:peptide deformylase
VTEEQHPSQETQAKPSAEEPTEISNPLCQPVTLYPNPVLRQRATPVTEFGEDIEDLVAELFDTMYSIGSGVGLAANQIGRSESVFVFDCRDGLAGHVVNPVVQIDGDTLQDDWEGCLSLPGYDLSTVRYEHCRVSGQNFKGDHVGYVGERFRSRCFQHETDHLNGKLYIDYHPMRARKKLEAHMRKSPWYGKPALDPRTEMYRRAQSPEEFEDSDGDGELSV